MKKESENIVSKSDFLGYYVEGDYMTEETNKNEVIFSCKDKYEMELRVSNNVISLSVPHDDMSTYHFVFNNREDWENFCESIWKTENYIPMKKIDFIKFFEALSFAYSYHQQNLEVAKRNLIKIQREVNEQEKDLDKINSILIGYQEVYNENKI